MNHYAEALTEHLTERGWTPDDIAHFSHMVGHSALMSSQGALSVLEFQQATDERLAAEAQHDEWAIGPIPIIERPDAGQLDQSLRTA